MKEIHNTMSSAASTSSRPTKTLIGAFFASALGFVLSTVHPGFALAAAPATAGVTSSAALLLGVAWKYLQTHFGWVQIEATKVASEIETDYPHIKQVVTAAEPLLQTIPGFQNDLTSVHGEVANVKDDLKKALDALNAATDGASGAIEAKVDEAMLPLLRKYLPSLFPVAPAAPVAPVVAPATSAV